MLVHILQVMKKRLIDADELKRRFNREYGAELGWYDLMRTYNLIDEMPTAEPEKHEDLALAMLIFGAFMSVLLLLAMMVVH